ncbi:6-bladed beta-propeller [Belliella sp. R4-6]|uniref:6-bladed beta-propeller n=1 Tax=Belliella alkalica TaxID=1730871 RepID=A0ABS9V7Q6_9BACT|nr:6-bladed beta-propeller [Belliella alkalica]MCH7412454.1 6-bladed beta-propeller [Belliella alkalica]
MNTNRNRNLLLVCMITLCMSCGKQSGNDAISIENIEQLTFEKVDLVTTSMFAQEISYIPLELRGDNLIGEIFKIIYSDSTFLIGDKSKSRVYGFDSSGKWEFSIDAKGQGPGEYNELSDFYVSEGNEIHIFCRSLQKILVYDFDGNFIDEVFIRHYVNAIHHESDNKFITYSSVSDYINTDYRPAGISALSITNESIHNKNLISFGGDHAYSSKRQYSFFSKSQNELFILSPSDTIFSYNSGIGLEAKYVLDFEDIKVPERLKTLPNTVENHQIINESGAVRLKDYFVKSRQFISFEFLLDEYVYWSFRNNDSTKMIYSYLLSDDINNFPYSAPKAIKDDDELISIITQDQWKSLLDAFIEYKKVMIENRGEEYFESNMNVLTEMIKNEQPVLAIAKLKSN